MNIMVSYNHLQELEKSESYLQKALPYADMEDNENFLFSFRMAQYDLYWRQGKNRKLELREKERERQEEQKKSRKDSLTDLGNRYKLKDDSIEIQREAIQKKTTMMVGILDVDCFKQYNDTYGHIQGDECLKSVAGVLEDVVQGKGEVYRFGGDEFIIIASDLSLLQVEEIAQDVKQRIDDLHIPNINAFVYPEVTISQGYCVFMPEEEGDMEEIISKADAALYKVKKAGRNTYSIRDDC